MVDVCLILEGTYPYVVGGVSKWTHALIKNLSHLKFSIVHLYDERKETMKYPIPENVESIVEIDVKNGLGFKFDFSDVLDLIPRAKVYHCLSTGFAGVLGLQIKSALKRPLIVTEHGIYWKELEFGVYEVECGFKIFKSEKEKMDICVARREFLRIFKKIAIKCYLEADLVTTVCKYNLEQQLSLIPEQMVEDVKHKFKVIENFIEPGFFNPAGKLTNSEKVVTFIGRVVPIKDVKTFIKSMPLILRRFPKVKFLIVGDLTQDSSYSSECIELADSLGVSDKVKFIGEARALDYLKSTDILVLPSVSEAQPFVILEAIASGIPVVATSVGGVPEILNERGVECGLLFDTGDHEKLAEHVIKLLMDENLWKKFSENAIKKAQKFTLEKFIKSYSKIYSEFIKS
jgi:glycosyltransferase involved in cell wall biosynthesis